VSPVKYELGFYIAEVLIRLCPVALLRACSQTLQVKVHVNIILSIELAEVESAHVKSCAYIDLKIFGIYWRLLTWSVTAPTILIES
jgi:hypothetical protein